MTIDLYPSVPVWASVRHPIDVGFVLVNRGPDGAWVNRRCAVGHPASLPDIVVEVFDRHGRRMPSRRVHVEPPTKEDFVWLEPGGRAFGEVYDVLWDHDLPVGKYIVELTWREPREPGDLPTDLLGMIFRPSGEKTEWPVEVIHWGSPPPRQRWSAR